MLLEEESAYTTTIEPVFSSFSRLEEPVDVLEDGAAAGTSRFTSLLLVAEGGWGGCAAGGRAVACHPFAKEATAAMSPNIPTQI